MPADRVRPLTFLLNGVKYTLDVQRELRITEDNLDRCLRNQAGYRNFYAQLYREAELCLVRAEDALDIWMSGQKNRIRVPSVPGVAGKMTETAIEDQVKVLPEYAAGREMQQDLRRVVGSLKDAVAAFDERGRMLSLLGRLATFDNYIGEAGVRAVTESEARRNRRSKERE
jgi:hypothetical protein